MSFLFAHIEATLILIFLFSAILIGNAVFVIMDKLPIAEPLKRKRVLFSYIIGIGGGVFVVLGGAFAVLAATSENNQERIAMAVLFADDASTSQVHMRERPSPALTGALNGKFLPGTNTELLKNFVAKLGGNCHQGQLGQPLICSIDESKIFCGVTSLLISAKTNNLNQVEGIEAFRISEVC
jgi:hypothetical protein